MKLKNKIPNYLTLGRMILVVALMVIATIRLSFTSVTFPRVYRDFGLDDLLILVIFLVASFTDFLDGYLARKFNAVSNFGKLLDPVADKLLVNVTILVYLGLGRIPFIIAALFIGRDILVDGLRMLALEKRVVIAASRLGKAKTVLQIVALTLVILGVDERICLAALIVAVTVSLLGMVEYYLRNLSRLRDEKVS